MTSGIAFFLGILPNMKIKDRSSQLSLEYENGCENLRIIDGNWKLCVQHCLYSIPMEIDGQPLLNFPSVCTEQLLKKLGPSAVNDVPEDLCNKDTGEKSHMRQRARGHVVVVSGGGNILSESPSQVFVQIVNVLYMETAHMTPEEQEEAIKKYIISYDNICHLDKLKAAQQDLPLPSPLNKIWKLVTKIIDRLHIRNHKDKQCQQKYNPEKRSNQKT
ncbi:unnamed protein product [Mytilus edulis]|uniref:Uncharacterized protein n=1 Tax=Mytilus edulis TaxID=6550 RepID=A0A8S3U2C3_MYTED|nr:unnamed protein product [Mytilus edulis]